MSNLDPEPPKILKNIKWFLLYGRQHIIYIIIATFIFIGLRIVPFHFNPIGITQKTKKTINSNKYISMEDGNKQKATNKNIEAPQVRFIDGKVRTVEMNVQAQLNPELLLKVHQLYGSQNTATKSLQLSIKNEAIDIMETKSENYVRTHRKEIANVIINRTKEAQKRTGYMIVELSIGKIY